MLKLDLGGVGRGGEWMTVNLDTELRGAPDCVADISAEADQLHGLFGTQTVDAIRSIHTLEHLPPDEIMPTLSYWREMLKPGGTLLIVVPDMASLARDYVGGVIPFEIFAAVTYADTGRAPELERHRWGWDAKTLAADLAASGYTNVRVGGDEDWRPSHWYFDYPKYAYTKLLNVYQVANLRMVGENPV